MKSSFYIPINSGSLAHYFSKAIILPAKYFSNKSEDIQNTVGDSILISESKWVKNCDCSMQVVLTDAEVKELNRVSEHFFLSNTPIPISRVKLVCFLDAKQKETTIWDINNGAAFIPEKIVSVEDDLNIEFISAVEILTNDLGNSATDISDKIRRFDIILGGFAFMRLGGSSFMNFSPNFFATLSYFNKLIEEQTNNVAKEKGLKFSYKYTGLFSTNESEWRKWLSYIYNNLEPQDIETLAEKEGEKVEKKLGVLKIDSINTDSLLYELAILATYGDRKNKSTDNLVTDLTSGAIRADKMENVAILFGLNNGYSKLRNKYKGSVKDRVVKFTMESQLDYYIIESIFQFVFHGLNKNNSFDYIDKWCPIKKQRSYVKGYVTYRILDSVIIAKKKPTAWEIFSEKYSHKVYSKITNVIKQWVPPFFLININEGNDYFEKLLINLLQESVEELKIEIENQCADDYDEIKLQIMESYQKEIDKLQLEISSLKEENMRFKIETNTLSETTKESLEKGENAENEYLSKNNNLISSVQEPISEISKNYDGYSINDLKMIAKEKGLSEAMLRKYKDENRDGLIELIINAKEPPK